MAIFLSITVYNINFEIVPHKISNPEESLNDYLKSAAFLYRIKSFYPDFAVVYRSLTCTKLLSICEVMKRQMDEC